MDNKKKKILIFVPEFPKLSETFIEREVSKLVERNNFDVLVFSLKRADGKLSENLKDRIIYRRLNVFTAFLGFLAYLFDSKKSSQALSLFSSANYSPLGKIYIISKGFGYAKILKTYKPDHIHAHFLSKSSSTLIMIVAQYLGVPYSVSAHAKDVFVEADMVSQKAYTAKFITVCNHKALRRCIELSGIQSPKNIYLNYHGFDPKQFEAEAFQSLPKFEKPFVFSIGRLVEKKGFQYLIEAAKFLKERRIAHIIKIAGPGPLYEKLNDQIKKAGLENQIEILGEGKGLPFEEIIKYYRIADVFVLPSVETNEGDIDGVPNVLIEAAFFKLPIVTTNAGSIPEFITNGETGLIALQKNPYDLANTLEKVVIDADLRKSLGDKAYLKAKEMFDINKNIVGLENLLAS